jgi:protein-tyrosine phosphatase
MAAVIDLHTHVLPGVDDGPATLAGSVAIAEHAALGGTRVLVATPHLRADHPAVRPDELGDRAAALDARLRERGMPVRVLPGAEVDLAAGEALDDAALAQATLGGGGTDLLLESPHGALPEDFERRVHALLARVPRIVLAHPERTPAFRADPALLDRLLAAGVLLQVTSRAVGARGRGGALATRLLRAHKVHALASDAHAVDRRPPDLAAMRHRAAAALPGLEAEIEWLVTAAPRAILDGLPLPERPPRTRTRLFSRGR